MEQKQLKVNQHERMEEKVEICKPNKDHATHHGVRITVKTKNSLFLDFLLELECPPMSSSIQKYHMDNRYCLKLI